MPDYELTDIHTPGVWRFALGIAVATALIGAAVFGFFVILEHRGPASRRSEGSALALPAPRLQTSPRSDLAKMRAADEKRLHEYGWIDRDAGVVRLPIERAMDLVVERGLPARQP